MGDKSASYHSLVTKLDVLYASIGEVYDHLLYLNCTPTFNVTVTSTATTTKAESIEKKTTTTTIETIPSSLLDQKIDEITAGLPASFGRNLRLLSNNGNIPIIVKYIQTMKTETSLSEHYRKDSIESLTRFCNFHNSKLFKDITREDMIAFLDSFRKPESIDPLHRWKGTYNNIYRMHLFRFFKWLYSPDIESSKRPNPTAIENIPQQKRKEILTYKPSDLWTAEDDLLFLRYCPYKRDKCYHAMSRDLSCRPVEILKLKIKDIAFKTIGTSQYAEVVVNGKTGTRHIPHVPFLKI